MAMTRSILTAMIISHTIKSSTYPFLYKLQPTIPAKGKIQVHKIGKTELVGFNLNKIDTVPLNERYKTMAIIPKKYVIIPANMNLSKLENPMVRQLISRHFFSPNMTCLSTLYQYCKMYNPKHIRTYAIIVSMRFFICLSKIRISFTRQRYRLFSYLPNMSNRKCTDPFNSSSEFLLNY